MAKKYNNWRQNQSTDEFLDYVSSIVGIPVIELTKVIKGGSYANGRKEIIGTYGHPKLLTDICSWVSPKFKYKVACIIEAYSTALYKQNNIELTQRNDDLNKKIENLEKLILSGQDETKKQNIELKTQLQETEEKNEKRHNELMGVINSAIAFLDKEKSTNQEILLIYRLNDEPKNTLHIRAGKRSSFKIPKKDECSYLFIGEHISNAKRILRFLKDKNILPTNGSSSTYQIDSGSTRKKIYNIVGGVNDKYQELSKKTPQ